MRTAAELADFVAVLRVQNSEVSQPERVLRLLATEDPRRVLDGIRPPSLFDDDAPAMIAEVESWLRAGYSVTTILDDDYPTRLREVREAPALVFTIGDLHAPDVGVSVVGTRKASPAQCAAAADVASAIGEMGISVVSGLAEGIDTAAHTAALDAGHRTVAVMGTGLDSTYPAANRRLRKRIEASGGLVLSQFFPAAQPSKSSFPMRNAVMSGYGIATVVIAAGEHSGTRHQVKAAISHGRALILTRGVATGTTWGRTLIDSPNVYVAGSPGGVVDAIHSIRSQLDVSASLF